MIAEQRALPSAEAVEGHRHRNRHIDTDHADLHAVHVSAGRIAVAREDRRAIAELVIVDQLDRLIEGFGAHDAEHRPENLFFINAHVGGHFVEQRRADEEAVLIALQLHGAAIDDQLGAFLHADIDVRFHLVAVRRRHQRPHLGLGIVARPHFQGAHARRQHADQRVRRRTHRDRDRDRHAAFACRAIGGAHQGIYRLLEIGVGHDDHMVFSAAERLHALSRRRAGAIDIFGDRRRADEAHRLNVRMGEDGVDRLLAAIDDIEHAGRATRLDEQFGQAQRAARHLLRRFEDEGVAAGDRHREHPHRHHGREVERRDAGADAERLAQRIAVDVGADVFAIFAFQEMRDAAGEFDDFQTALQRTEGVGMDLAMLVGDQSGELVGMFLDQFLETEHDAGAPQRRGRRPAGKGLLRGSDSGRDLHRASHGNARGDFTARRIEHIGIAHAAFGRFAVYEMLNVRHEVRARSTDFIWRNFRRRGRKGPASRIAK